jgi:hypothetical protein
MDKKLAAAFLIRAWEGESTHVPEEAWSVYDPALHNEQLKRHESRSFVTV